MPSDQKAYPEKNSKRIIRRLRRLMRKILWKNNHINRPRRSSPRIPDPKPILPVRRRRHGKSFWRKLFGRRKNWQNRLTGEQERKKIELEKEAAFIFKPQDPATKMPIPSPQKKRRKRAEGGFLKRLSRRLSKQKQIPQKPSDIIWPQAQGVQIPSSYHRKRKRNIFKRLFGKKEKKPVKLAFPLNKPLLPHEKEQVIYKAYLPYFVNSTMLFLLAYLLAWLTYQAVVIITSAFFHIDSVLFFYEVMFPVGNSSELWSSFDIILITISGPITSLVTGSLYYVFLVRNGKVKGNRLMFFNWLIIHSYCMFFAAFVAGVITNQGFGYVANWLYMNVFFKILFSLIFLFSLSWISFKNAGHILETSNSVFRIKPKNRMFFLFSQTVFPWFVGTLLLILVKYPRITPQHENILVYDLIIIVSILFMIIPPFFNKEAAPKLVVEKERRQTRISKRNIFLALLALFIFRAGLAGGLHFILHFSINVSRYM